MSKDKFEVEEGSAPISQEDIIKMFFILIRQNQEVNNGATMSFPLEIFKTLPKKLELSFEKKDGRLFVSVPFEEGRKKRKKRSTLLLPANHLILHN